MSENKTTISAWTCALSLSEATVTVNDLELFYRTGGSGPPLLLIHGFTGTGHAWNPFVDELGAHHTVIIPDLPGHGRSTGFPGAFSYRKTAGIMFALLDALGVDCVQGIGHSAGGNTLIHMAAQRAERVEAMVLVDGAHRLTVAARDGIRERFFWENQPEDSREWYRQVHPGGEPQIRSILAQLRGLADNYDDFDFSPEHLATIPTRTLLVWGDRDWCYPIEIAVELYQALPNAALWVVPNHGHTPIWEVFGGSAIAARIFCPVVREFLEQGQTDDGP